MAYAVTNKFEQLRRIYGQAKIGIEAKLIMVHVFEAEYARKGAWNAELTAQRLERPDLVSELDKAGVSDRFRKEFDHA